MFTGLVEELGTVRGVDRFGDAITLTIESPLVVCDATLGSSIAVNGCCLTVIAIDGAQWQANAVPETMQRTNLGGLRIGSKVNLERAMPADGRFGGHIVQGHIDATTSLRSITPQSDGSARYRFTLPRDLMRYVAVKSSITVDGISLTVADVGDDWFDVAVIPHTSSVTTLGHRAPGDAVNLEVDVLAKYVERQLAASVPTIVVETESSTTHNRQGTP